MSDHTHYYTNFLVRSRLKAPVPKKDLTCDYPYTRLPPRRCLLEPVPAIYQAQDLLNRAANWHLADEQDREKAKKAIYDADLLEIEIWMESIWGPYLPAVHRRLVEKPAEFYGDKDKRRHPDKELKQKVIDRDGYHCRWCGIPVISTEARDHLKKAYPDAFRWGSKNRHKHAAFQAMTHVENHDHVIPRSRGGHTSLENLIVSCSPCNAGRLNFLPEEMCLIRPIPEEGPWIKSDWDGLKRVLKKF